MRGIHREWSWISFEFSSFILCLRWCRKMRSDSIIASDPRASVLVAPPGTDPKLYTQQSHSNSRPDGQKWHRGGRGRGRGGRGRRGGGGERGAGMDIDG
jgi:hypothetical protein